MGEHHKLSSGRDVEVRLECLHWAIDAIASVGPVQTTPEQVVSFAQKFYWFATARRGDGDE